MFGLRAFTAQKRDFSFPWASLRGYTVCIQFMNLRLTYEVRNKKWLTVWSLDLVYSATITLTSNFNCRRRGCSIDMTIPYSQGPGWGVGWGWSCQYLHVILGGCQLIFDLPFTPGGVLPKDLGGDVRCTSGNPHPISDQNMWFSLPYFTDLTQTLFSLRKHLRRASNSQR